MKMTNRARILIALCGLCLTSCEDESSPQGEQDAGSDPALDFSFEFGDGAPEIQPDSGWDATDPSPCRGDYDCPVTAYCDDCAAASCSTCTDCIAACIGHGCETEATLECDLPRPDCPRGVAVIQDGCWRCVNTSTCEPTGPDLHPIDFVIQNVGELPMYFELTWGGQLLGVDFCPPGFECTSVSLWSPGCVMSCDSIEPDEPWMCCIDCDAPMPSIVEIAPGESWTVSWDGRTTYQMDYLPCDCGCYGTQPPRVGDYLVEACLGGEFTCLDGDACLPEESGVPFTASLSGDQRCYHAEMSISSETDEVIIEVAWYP